MVSTATSSEFGNQDCAMEMEKPDPPTRSSENVEPQKEHTTGTIILPEKGESSEDPSLISDENESEKSSLESNSLSNGLILKEVKFVAPFSEKKLKKKFYWYGNHKLVKPIKDIPPRFQLMLAETNAEKVRCEGRPIILHQETKVNSEATRGSTPFNPEAQCFVPHQSSKINISPNEALIPLVGKESTTPNGEMLAPVTGSSVPFNPVPPMYTIHVYSNPTNSTNLTAVPTPGVNNGCCMHLSNVSSPMFGSPTTTVPAAPIQGPPMYYGPQAYPQQTYTNPQYPPGFMTAASAPSTLPTSLQYTPGFTYTQNTYFTSASLPQ